jgi:hypothetical protein
MTRYAGEGIFEWPGRNRGFRGAVMQVKHRSSESQGGYNMASEFLQFGSEQFRMRR